MLFDPVFDVLVGMLKGLIDANEIGERGVLFFALRVMPRLCREARDEARKDASFPYLMAYMNTVLDYRIPYHYCDLLPPAVDPAGLSQPIGTIERRVITCMEDTMKARIAMARDIDAATTPKIEGPRPDELSPTVPTNLPAKVKLFLYHLGMFHARFRANPQYDHFYKPCARKGCQRPARVPIPEHVLRQTNGAYTNLADNAKNERCYWHMCHSGDITGVNPHLPANMPFCSGACYCVTRDEYDRGFNLMARLPHLTAEGPPMRREGTEATPSRLYRAALARNMSINRTVRAPPDHTLCKHYPATAESARAMHRAFIDALNVDLGVLYAANVVHQLPGRHKKDTALPEGAQWREYPVFYTNAIATVRAIYLHGRTHDGVAKGSEKWLERVHARVRQVFP